MVEDSIGTFETFCGHQDMAALSAEQEFANQYRDVVQVYAGFAHEDDFPQPKVVPSPPQVIRWKNAGLRAIKGVVGSEAGLAADGGDSLRTILPVILENLYNGDDLLIAFLERQLQETERNAPAPDPALRRRYSAVTVQTVDTAEGDPALAARNIADVDKKAELDMRLLALRCLEQVIVNGSSRGQIRVTTKVVLDFILRKGQSNNTYLSLDTADDNWATSLIEVLAKWCPVQARFIISTAAMEVLFEIPPKEDTLDKAFTVIYIIDYLLKSSVNMIGLSVIDVLLGLMRYMAMLVSPVPEKSAEEEKETARTDENKELSLKKQDLLLVLEKCIGDITTHIYYGDQVVDMLRAILTRIRPSHGQEQILPAAAPEHPDGSTSEANPMAFYLTTAKVCALRAIKNILLVANSQRPMASAGVESRNPVGIHVWEGTHWLLQDPHKEVRYAYVDALLYWLRLETNKADLKLKDRSIKTAVFPSKRDFSDASERSSKRATGVHQREKAVLVAQSNFLRLLHVTIYEVALHRPTEETEIRILHLLLGSLVKSLGINSARFGLPMILRLQDDMASGDLSSSTAAIYVGSLVYGYLWALCETFDLDTFRVGKEIFTEIEKRKARNIWLDSIGFTLPSLDSILNDDRHAVGLNTRDTNQMIPFKGSAEELVRRIEETYNRSMSSHSPPSSPGRNLGKPVIGGHLSPNNVPPSDLLPLVVKEQMLSSWSKQSALEAAEREKSEALSLTGSRTGGPLPVRGHNHFNGTGSSILSNSPSAAHVATAGLQNARRMSMPDKTGTAHHSSSRDSPVHVNELRRVLSVQAPDRDRRLSPLRGRIDASNGSISSSSESMVSGFSNSEFEGDGGSIRPQTAKDGQEPQDGDETPRPLMSNSSNYPHSQTISRTNSYSIPPVPPIPHGISIPGGFPSDSQRSLATSDRPSTAPSRRQNNVNGNSSTVASLDQKTIHRQKSRTGAGFAKGFELPEVAVNGKLTEAQPSGQQEAEESSPRRNVQKLLDGVLSPLDADPNRQRITSSYSRRSVTGGIGRPPY